MEINQNAQGPSRGGFKEETEFKPPQVSRIRVDRKYTAGEGNIISYSSLAL